MAKLFSVMSPPVSATINEESRKPESYPCSSGLSQNHSDNNSCMNRSLRSEFSCTNVKKKSSTPQANSDESSSCSIKEHDYIGLAEIASSCESSDKCGESSGNGDLKLGLDLSLWVNDAEDKHNVGQSNPPDSMGTIQNARTLGTREFHSTEIARTKVNAVIGVKRSYSEALGGNGPQGGKDCVVSSGITPNVGQQRPVQCSDPAFLKKNRQGNPVNDLRKGNCLPFYWNSCGQSQVQPFIMAHSRMASVNGLCNLSNDRTDNQRSSFGSSFESSHDLKENCFPVAGEHSSARNQAVGWPPIRAYRKNSLSSHSKTSGDNKGSSLYVKVNMDGVPIGRKVDLNAHESYESLVQDLENMFQKTTEYHPCSWTPTGIQHVVSNVSKPLRLLDPTADVVLTYEDKDGDCMLVGDIPWKMFVNTVKRLRIMKTSDKNAFAERYRKKPNAT